MYEKEKIYEILKLKYVDKKRTMKSIPFLVLTTRH